MSDIKTVQALVDEIARAAFDEGIAHGKGAKNFCGSNGKVPALIDALIAQMQRDAVQSEFSRDDDGELLIDWSPVQGRMVSLSLRADGRLSYAFTWDGEKAHGTAQMPRPEAQPTQDERNLAAARMLHLLKPGHGLPNDFRLVPRAQAVHIDTARMDDALAGSRQSVPQDASSPEQVCNWLEAQALDSPLQQPERNQCDGCARGLPLTGRMHKGPGEWDMQVCTADRYFKPQQEDRAGSLSESATQYLTRGVQQAVKVCPAHDAACVEVPAGLRCKGCMNTHPAPSAQRALSDDDRLSLFYKCQDKYPDTDMVSFLRGIEAVDAILARAIMERL